MNIVEKLREQLYPFIQKSISQIDTVRILLALATIICGGSGVFYGYFLARASQQPTSAVSWVENISYEVPVLTIEGFSEKEIVFRTDKLGTRFAMGEELLSAPPEATFRIALSEKLRLTETVVANDTSSKPQEEAAPTGACPFVAGTTGKYVYAESDSRAKRLKTRRCFTSQEAAISAGLLVPEK